MNSDRTEHLQELLDKADDQIIEQAKEIRELKQEIERINTAFKRKIQNLETRYNAMIHKRDKRIEDLVFYYITDSQELTK